MYHQNSNTSLRGVVSAYRQFVTHSGAARLVGGSLPAARRSRLPHKPHESDRAPAREGAADLWEQARRAVSFPRPVATSAGGWA